MKLAYWMYTGPAHIGTLRIATTFKNVHAIMHAPLGDDYFNVMESMLERKRNLTSVTTSIVDRHVLAQGSKEKVIKNITRKDIETKPDLIVLTPTCTSSILQEDLENFVNRSSGHIKSDVILADVNHYRVNELEAANITLKQIISYYLKKNKKSILTKKSKIPSVNIIGLSNLNFHNQHDITELKRFFSDLKIKVNLIIPENCSVDQIQTLPKAWFNYVPFREIGLASAKYLEQEFNIPYIVGAPMGVTQTEEVIKNIENVLQEQNFQVNFDKYIENQTRFFCQSSWFSKSIDCQNLIGKTAIVFGDATHAAAFTKILSVEMGIKVVLSGTYCKEHENWFREQVEPYTSNIIISNDQNIIAEKVKKLKPNAIFGTQMERHVGKRLNIPCGVISSPIHIQNFPLSYKPFVGYEGANQISDLIYNSFTLGMEDHLLEIFGGHDTKTYENAELVSEGITWSPEASKQLEKIPKFVRNQVKEKVEFYAKTKNLKLITPTLIYEAKEKSEN